jgi:hypothetical protein
MKKFNITSHKGIRHHHSSEIPCTPAKTQLSRKHTTNSYEDMMKRNLHMLLVGNVNKCHSYGNLYDSSLKNQQQQNLAIALSNDPAKPLLSIDLKECKSA